MQTDPHKQGKARQTEAIGRLDYMDDLKQAQKLLKGLRAGGATDAEVATRRAQLRAELLAKRHDLTAIQEALK